MMANDGRALRATVLLLVGLGLIGPIAAGLAETARAAFGLLPGLSDRPGWVRLAGLPGVGRSVLLTLWTGFAATGLALWAAFALAGQLVQRGGAGRIAAWLAPLLAAPHAAMAVGLAFLLAPSGWLARIVSPGLTGWQVPPDVTVPHDAAGLTLIAGLVLKELPFLLLVMLAALGQIPVGRRMATGRALGYAPWDCWVWIIGPALYRLIRLPVYVVLAFSLSTVDMAILLGPSNPPPLAVAMTRWFQSGDLGLFAPAAAAALLQGALVAGGIGLWALAERLVALASHRRLATGWRRHPAVALPLGAGLAGGLIGGGLMSLAALIVWSLADHWTFPANLPDRWTLRLWLAPDAGWGGALWRSLAIALPATFSSLLVAILWLEGEARGRYARARWAEALIYLPLLVPQPAFLFGLHIAALRLGLAAGPVAVIWAHVIFVFPYVMLALSEAWRATDPCLIRSAASLGAGPGRRLIAVRLPLLLGPLATAAAIGFAVSVAQYLPTLVLGAGRMATLTTEAVTLASGGDRRLTGLYAALQSALPLLVYGAALALPALVWRNRRGPRGQG